MLASSPVLQWRHATHQIRPKVPKQAVMMDEAETDVLAYMSFLPADRAKLHSANPLSASMAISSTGPMCRFSPSKS
jgi:putative transposase